ncbi:hypothetical protein LSAT2_005090, partial [Lamellibrachia satsuma]
MAHKEETTSGAAPPRRPGLDSKFLGRLARKFGDQQYQLGVDLRVKTATLKRILQENNDAVTGTLKILQNWKDTSESRRDLNAMFDELCSTLSELDNNDLVEFVRSEQSQFAHDVAQKNEQQTVQSDEGNLKQKEDEIKVLHTELRNCRQKAEGNRKEAEDEIKALKTDLVNCQHEAKTNLKQKEDEMKALHTELRNCRQKAEGNRKEAEYEINVLKTELANYQQKAKAEIHKHKDEIKELNDQLQLCRQKVEG